MRPSNRRIYFPPRNLIGSLVPTAIVMWYFLEKVGPNTPAKIGIIAAAVLIQFLEVAVSTRTRHTRRPFFWGIYDFLTGNGHLPLQLFVNGMVILAIIAFGFEISGLQREGGVPSAFISRYVEVNLYWTVLNFLGNSDNSIRPVGFSQVLTIIATMAGMMFWGMYISILVNKYSEIQGLFKQRTPDESLDLALYNEKPVTSEKPNTENLGNAPEVAKRSSDTHDILDQSKMSLHKGRNNRISSPFFVISGLMFWFLSLSLLLMQYADKKRGKQKN